MPQSFLQSHPLAILSCQPVQEESLLHLGADIDGKRPGGRSDSSLAQWFLLIGRKGFPMLKISCLGLFGAANKFLKPRLTKARGWINHMHFLWCDLWEVLEKGLLGCFGNGHEFVGQRDGPFNALKAAPSVLFGCPIRGGPRKLMS